jgi:hypothetical protein
MTLPPVRGGGLSGRPHGNAGNRSINDHEIVLLANVYVNDGQYPSTLSVADLERDGLIEDLSRFC